MESSHVTVLSFRSQRNSEVCNSSERVQRCGAGNGLPWSPNENDDAIETSLAVSDQLVVAAGDFCENKWAICNEEAELVDMLQKVCRAYNWLISDGENRESEFNRNFKGYEEATETGQSNKKVFPAKPTSDNITFSARDGSHVSTNAITFSTSEVNATQTHATATMPWITRPTRADSRHTAELAGSGRPTGCYTDHQHLQRQPIELSRSAAAEALPRSMQPQQQSDRPVRSDQSMPSFSEHQILLMLSAIVWSDSDREQLAAGRPVMTTPGTRFSMSNKHRGRFHQNRTFVSIPPSLRPIEEEPEYDVIGFESDADSPGYQFLSASGLLEMGTNGIHRWQQVDDEHCLGVFHPPLSGNPTQQRESSSPIVAKLGNRRSPTDWYRKWPRITSSVTISSRVATGMLFSGFPTRKVEPVLCCMERVMSFDLFGPAKYHSASLTAAAVTNDLPFRECRGVAASDRVTRFPVMALGGNCDMEGSSSTMPKFEEIPSRSVDYSWWLYCFSAAVSFAVFVASLSVVSLPWLLATVAMTSFIVFSSVGV